LTADGVLFRHDAFFKEGDSFTKHFLSSAVCFLQEPDWSG